MLTANALISNSYLYLLIGAFIVYVATFLGYIKKAKQRFHEYEKGIYQDVVNEHLKEPYSPSIVLKLFKKFQELEQKITNYKWCFKLYLPSFLGFIIFCLLGFIASDTIFEPISIIFLFICGLLFLVCLIFILIWDDKN